MTPTTRKAKEKEDSDRAKHRGGRPTKPRNEIELRGESFRRGHNQSVQVKKENGRTVRKNMLSHCSLVEGPLKLCTEKNLFLPQDMEKRSR